ncbi:acetolactate synthase small subunit, partial [Cutibacterium acnes subsp. acnes]|nr:acetolactate synthase small subunit [Cutibacterium acnes subsp. acnes]
MTRRVLSVSPTDDPSETRMTIGVDAVSAQALEQIIKQLNKLIEIHKIAEPEPSTVTRELILVKVRSNVENRSKIIDTVALRRAKAVDAS